MKIATWNINSLRLRLNLLKKFIDEHQPDIIALQETKVIDYAFPLGDCLSMGYQHIRFTGEKSYNGVAILSKIPVEEQFCLEFSNEQKRHIAAKIGNMEIHNFYVPAGGDIPDIELNPKFKHKLDYMDSMNEWFLANRKKSQNIILVGDLNVAPLEHDVWSSKQMSKIISHTDIERQKFMRNLNEFGFIDAPRLIVPESQKLYSWWSYRNMDWENSDRGRRLDHILVTPGLANKVTSTLSLRNLRKEDSPSDHVPVMITL